MAWVGQRAGASVPSEVEPVVVVLLFGVITDYCIFLLSRFRRLIADGLSPRDAATLATRDLLPTILTAGLTVAAASSALVVAQLSFFRAFGPGLAVAVLVGVLVATTFVPAALAVAGSSVFWPSRPGRDVPPSTAAEETPDEHVGRPVRSRAVSLAVAHPRLTVTACVAVLLLASSGVARLAVGNPLIRGLPEGAEARVAYRAAAQGFAPGILSPTVIVVEGRGITGATCRPHAAAAQRRPSAGRRRGGRAGRAAHDPGVRSSALAHRQRGPHVRDPAQRSAGQPGSGRRGEPAKAPGPAPAQRGASSRSCRHRRRHRPRGGDCQQDQGRPQAHRTGSRCSRSSRCWRSSCAPSSRRSTWWRPPSSR